MSKIYIRMSFLMVMLCSLSWGQNLLHYWNFNNNGSVAAITAPTQTNIAGASITANITGISAIDFAGGTGQNFNIQNLNARNGDASGTHLRFNDPIGSALVFALPTTGYENILVKFATRRSGSGAGTQVWSYTTDGTNYTFFSNVIPNNGDPGLATLDFSAIAAANNNSNFKLKVEFQQGTGGTVGNNRFDNFTAEGAPFTGGGDTTAPSVAFLPLNGATNVASSVHPTLTFNENVRLLDNSAITNTNVDAIVEVRLNNASGTLVPFDATFASNTITITPASALTNNQLYYVALLANTIEDTSDNAITTTQSASFTTANPSSSSIDLSTYVRVARYNLPEPLTTTAPANNLLCQEASAVAYNWDTDTLFITGDGSTAIVQVSKTGQLIDTMTMAQGSSPQGTDFYDTEGLTYIGGGQFVMSEERDRQLVKFTYAAGTTLTRANTQTVKIGTFVPNTGTEGLSFDPITGGFICLKEIDPIGIFQTNVDFAAGTATNGSATTVNSINLFDPALLGFTDVADVFALSNLPVTSGPLLSNLLVLSQENAQVKNVDRNGNVASTLTIVADPSDTLSVSAQQHEGITMDNNGIIYIVNENGGGDINHPQLWVYAPSNGTNQAPTAVALTNTVPTIIENSVTTPAVRVADIVVTDDGLGTNTLSLSGADALSFQITGSSLYIKPGTVLDFETKSTYNVTVNVDDATVGTTPDTSVNFVLSVTDLVNETPQLPTVTISEVAPWGSGNSPAAADWFEVTNNGATALNITGWKVDDNSNSFAAAIALTGITSIAPGESVIFLESSASNPAATVVANFKSLWFGANPPAGLQVGTYQGSGIGLSTGGDAVNLYDASGTLQASVVFGASPTTLFKTFNNAQALNNATITVLSEIGVNDAFAATNDALEIGSPGSVGRLFISEVAPWSSGNSPVAADWFEVTNTKAVAVDITGWKVDDNSQSPVAAVALNGIASINPGESVIFIETNDLAGKTTAFLNNWFGTHPTTLRIGNYTGSGVGLGTGGDQVNLYNNSGVLQTSVLFGASPATAPYTSFDNKAGVNSLVTPIAQFSAVGVNGAFVATNSPSEIGSPGTIVTSNCTVSVTAPTALTVSANNGCTATGINLGMPTVSSDCMVISVTNNAPLAFPLGTTTVTWTATTLYNTTFTATQTVTVTDTTSPTIYFQLSALLPGITGPSTTQSPYLLSQSAGGKFTSVLSVNDVVGSYRMVGIPDGLGAFDNNDGTFTLLMNHELGNTQGIARAHGSTGAFVSKWIINKSGLSVVSGSDLIQTVYTWNTGSNSFVQGPTQFNRFCSADLAPASAFFNQATGLGTLERIFLNGEESGSEGRAFGHIITGTAAGTSYELPYLGKFSWENAVASPSSGVKTVVAGTDDATVNGQVYFYIGTKTNTGTEIDKAGLNNGKLFGVKVTGLSDEVSGSIPAPNTAFTLADLGFVQNSTGVTLNSNSVTAGVTNFLRPEDGAFDPSNPNDFYFVTTNAFTAPSRLWRLRFNDIANPETGGTITAVLDGTEGQRMLDNMTIDKFGHILLQEDPGGQAHSAKVWQYTIATDALELVGKHDPARFGDLVGSVTTPATSPFNNDEESSGIIDMCDILGPGMFLMDVQAHYTTGLSNLTEVVQGGQLVAFFNPASMIASPVTAAPAEIKACSGTGIDLGTPFTADNCSVASITNNAPSIFPVGTTTVTWTVTDASGNTSTATQTVTVTNLVASATAGTITCNDGTTTVTVTATGGTAPYTGTGTFTVGAGAYSYTVTDATGCSSTVTGTITQPSQLTTSTTITSSTPYTWSVSGLTYGSSGVYTFNTVNANGCTVINTLNLTITVNSFNLGTSCGATVSSLAVTVVAGAVPGASAYTFRITNLNTSSSFVITRPVNSFALSNYPGITLGTPYQVEVSVNGGANYGTPCIINTPAPTSTIGAQCGTVLTSMSQFVYATYYAQVSAYRFRVTNMSTNAVQVYDALSGQNRFSFSQLPASFVSFGTAYYVEVALRNTDGTYLPFSTGCTLTTPAFPTSEIILSQCDYTATSATQMISAQIVPGASAYRFQLVNSALSYSLSIDRNINTFNLSMFPGLQPGTTYMVRVAVKIGDVWGPLTGKACNLTTPGTTPGSVITRFKEVEGNEFSAVAYPNPFAENFILDVKTTSQDSIKIKVYDMLGHQVEDLNADVSQISAVHLGEGYATGVYNVVVSQGENTQIIRMVKR